MSTFSCPVVRVASVSEHPNADRLSIVHLEGLGYTCISAKLPDGSPRYKVGDWVVYIPSAAVLPEWLLKEMDFWNAEMGKGTLAGTNGDRVKPLKLRGIFSEGLLYPVKDAMDDDGHDGDYWIQGEHQGYLLESNWVNGVFGPMAADVSEILGISKYEPPIPAHMAGEVANMFGHTIKYDFERLESVPDLFDAQDYVTATEKLHGCIHKDSMIMLPNGEQVSISHIVAGLYTHVLSYDPSSNQYMPRKITGRSKLPNLTNKKWVMLTMANGQSLTLTEDHPIYSRDRQKWINASEVMPNEDLESPIC